MYVYAFSILIVRYVQVINLKINFFSPGTQPETEEEADAGQPGVVTEEEADAGQPAVVTDQQPHAGQADAVVTR